MGLHRPVLVRLAGIVAARQHPVVAAEVIVALVTSCAASRSRLRYAAERLSVRCSRGTPPRVQSACLQVLGQRGEALAALNDADVFPAAVAQHEVVEPVGEGPAGDGDAELPGIGEVGQRHVTWRRRLAEDDVLVRAMQRSPVAYPPLQRPPDAIAGERSGSARRWAGASPPGRRSLSSIGWITSFQIPSSGSGPCGLARRRWDGRRASASSRRAVRSLNPARAAAAFWVWSGGHACRSHLLVGDGFARHQHLRLVDRDPVTAPQRPAPSPSPPSETIAPQSSAYGGATPTFARSLPVRRVVAEEPAHLRHLIRRLKAKSPGVPVPGWPVACG